MKVQIPYDLESDTMDAEIDEGSSVDVVEHNSLPSSPPQQAYLNALKKNNDSIFKILNGKRSVAVMVDDHTRPTQPKFVLPELLNLIETSGIKYVKIIVAPGSHNIPEESYFKEKIGGDIYSSYPIIFHNAYSKEDNVFIGETSFGTPLFINRWVVSADVKISIGTIFPSSLAGFTGGGKMILPGVAGEESIDKNHSLFSKPECRWGKIDGNPMREDIDEASKIAGLDLIIDAVMLPDKKIVSVNVGDPVIAFKGGAKISSKIYKRKLPKGNIVICGCGLTDDIDFVNCSKSVEIGDEVCENNGVIILVARCRLGVQWDELLEALEFAKKGNSKNGEAFANFFIRRYSSVFLERTKKVFWVTDKKNEGAARSLGFFYFPDLQSALDEAVSVNGDRMVVLPRGSLLMP